MSEQFLSLGIAAEKKERSFVSRMSRAAEPITMDIYLVVDDQPIYNRVGEPIPHGPGDFLVVDVVRDRYDVISPAQFYKHFYFMPGQEELAVLKTRAAQDLPFSPDYYENYIKSSIENEERREFLNQFTPEEQLERGLITQYDYEVIRNIPHAGAPESVIEEARKHGQPTSFESYIRERREYPDGRPSEPVYTDPSSGES